MRKNSLLLQEPKCFYHGRDFSRLVSGFCQVLTVSRVFLKASAIGRRWGFPQALHAWKQNPGTQGNALLVGTLIISIGEVSLSIAISSSHVGKHLCEKRITWVASTYRRRKYEPWWKMLLKVLFTVEACRWSPEISWLYEAYCFCNELISLQVHLEKEASIPDHCVAFSFSDASNPEYQVQCQHNHEDTCEQFEELNETENRINCCHFSSPQTWEKLPP